MGEGRRFGVGALSPWDLPCDVGVVIERHERRAGALRARNPLDCRMQACRWSEMAGYKAHRRRGGRGRAQQGLRRRQVMQQCAVLEGEDDILIEEGQRIGKIGQSRWLP